MYAFCSKCNRYVDRYHYLQHKRYVTWHKQYDPYRSHRPLFPV